MKIDSLRFLKTFENKQEAFNNLQRTKIYIAVAVQAPLALK